MIGVGLGYIVICVVQEFVFPHSSVTVHVIIDIPTLKLPLASTPDPLRIVTPFTSFTSYAIVKLEVQLSLAINGGMAYVPLAISHRAGTVGQVTTGAVLSSFLVVAGEISQPAGPVVPSSVPPQSVAST